MKAESIDPEIALVESILKMYAERALEEAKEKEWQREKLQAMIRDLHQGMTLFIAFPERSDGMDDLLTLYKSKPPFIDHY